MTSQGIIQRVLGVMLATAISTTAPACDGDKPADAQPERVGGAIGQPVDRSVPESARDGEKAGDDVASDLYAGFDPRVARAAKVARRIEADPTRADETLEELGMDRDQLDSLMYEIAREPELTGEYRVARGL